MTRPRIKPNFATIKARTIRRSGADIDYFRIAADFTVKDVVELDLLTTRLLMHIRLNDSIKIN